MHFTWNTESGVCSAFFECCHTRPESLFGPVWRGRGFAVINNSWTFCFHTLLLFLKDWFFFFFTNKTAFLLQSGPEWKPYRVHTNVSHTNQSSPSIGSIIFTISGRVFGPTNRKILCPSYTIKLMSQFSCLILTLCSCFRYGLHCDTTQERIPLLYRKHSQSH